MWQKVFLIPKTKIKNGWHITFIKEMKKIHKNNKVLYKLDMRYFSLLLSHFK